MTAARRKARPVGRSERGFTLMEMLVVLVLIGLIAAVAIPQVMRMFEGAKAKAARIQLQTVGQSLHFYQLDNGDYPDVRQGLAALWTAPEGVEGWTGPYVRREEQLVDPWGRKLLYAPPAEGKNFTLKTLGADGAEGGSGDDADIAYKP